MSSKTPSERDTPSPTATTCSGVETQEGPSKFLEACSKDEQEMVKLATYYILIVKGKLPAKKSQIIKHAMKQQAKDFSVVITRTAKGLRKIFGFQLIGLKPGPDGTQTVCTGAQIAEANTFFVKNAIKPPTFMEKIGRPDLYKDTVRAVLLLILSSSFMMNQPLDEEQIWHILEKMRLTRLLGLTGEEGLSNFLKKEFVDPLYLVKQERNVADEITVRYGWGIRAQLEVDKYMVLKFVAGTLKRDPREFPVQYESIRESEVERIEKEKKNGKKDEGSQENEAPAILDLDRLQLDDGDRGAGGKV